MNARTLVTIVINRITEKTSAAGKPYLLVNGREGNGPDARWWGIMAFRAEVIAEIQRLQVGDALAVSGAFNAQLYSPKEREVRVNLSLTADAAISTRPPPKAQKKAVGTSPRPQKSARQAAAQSWAAPGGGEFDDDIPF